MIRQGQTLTVVALAMIALAGCTSSSSVSGSPLTPLSTTTDAPISSDTGTPTDPATATPTTSTATPTKTAATTAPASDTCTFAQLGIRVIRGSGALQREYASVLFTNTSTKRCTMFGFPGVSLRRAGQLLGQPATREAITPKNLRLAPGGRAQADITDVSTCQAPLSDTVRVYPPDSKQFVDLPLDLRGCALSVRPVVGS